MADNDQLTSPFPIPGGMPQGADVLPAASPVQSPDTDALLKQQMLQQSQQGSQAFSGEMARRQQLAQQLAGLQQQRAGLQAPPQGYSPTMQPMTGQGFGGDVKNILGNIGKGLLQGAAATIPGQRIQEQVYGPAYRAYQTQAGSLAQQIEEIQKQMGPESEAMQAATGMSYRPMMGYGAVQRGEAAQTSAGAKVMSVQTQAIHEQHWNTLQQGLLQLRDQLGQGKLTQEAARTKAMILIANENNATKRDVATQITDAQQRDTDVKAVEDFYNQQSSHMVERILGFGPETPSAPVTVPRTGGQRTVQPTGGGAKGGGMVRMKAPNGQIKPVPADQVEHYKSMGAVQVK